MTSKERTMPELGIAPAPSQQEVHDAYEALYERLSDAYWAASTIQDKDRIRGLEDALYDILTDLNAANLRSRTADYQTCKGLVEATNARLSTLKEDLDKVIHAVKIATQVAGALDKALAIAVKFFV
jgi:hypothetical protein